VRVRGSIAELIAREPGARLAARSRAGRARSGWIRMTRQASPPAHDRRPVWRRELRPMNLLLLAVPLAAILEVCGVSGVWMFAAAGLGVVPLAGWIGRATEMLALRAGAGIGGLLNATFGNAAELIIALMLLSRGTQMYPIVRASITGSILGNLLLVLGAAITLGGLKFRKQTFDSNAAGVGTTLLAIAAAGMLIPTMFFYLPRTLGIGGQAERVKDLSEEIAVVLILLYGASLVFSLRTHRELYAHDDVDEGEESEGGTWSIPASIGVLFVAMAAVAFLSEWMVDSIEAATKVLGMSSVFVGVIVVGIVGNAAEHASACRVAMKGKMDLALQIAVSSSTQVALFVAPVLVFASLLFGHAYPLDLHFGPLEVASVVISVAVVALVARDGESNWLEGVMLLALYAILGLAFYNLPAGAGSSNVQGAAG
jgi:Ca2+:H+ antiporter